VPPSYSHKIAFECFFFFLLSGTKGSSNSPLKTRGGSKVSS